jgi:hypothetical protein
LSDGIRTVIQALYSGACEDCWAEGDGERSSAAPFRAPATAIPRVSMIASLEAIFLSTFVMISENRADAKRQVVADEQWQTVRMEDKQNEELLQLSREILQLTKEVRTLAGDEK